MKIDCTIFLTFSGHQVNSITLISGSSATIYSLKDQDTFQRNFLKYEIELYADSGFESTGSLWCCHLIS